MDGEGDEVLRAVVDGGVLERYGAELEAARDRLRVRAPGAERPVLAGEGPGGALDPYAVSAAARELLLGPAVVGRVGAQLGGAPLLFAAAETSSGAPEEGPYREATYVGLDDPSTPLVAAVAALGDGVTITVFGGSQRLGLPRFSGRHRHFNAERDGAAALDAHRAALRAGLGEATTLTLAAGDVLLIDGDLVHEPAAGPALAALYCPVGAAPAWFAYREDRALRVPHGDGWYASAHADLREAPGARATAPEPRPHLEPEEPATPPRGVVQDELGHHGRRAAGLVGTVRGIMGRRGRR